MSAFAKILTEKVESYIELRRSLGYSFRKQAATLRALARFVETEQLDGPLTQGMALNFVLSIEGAANGRAIRHGVLHRFCEYLAVYDARTEALDRRAFERSGAGITHCGVQPPLANDTSSGANADDAGRLVGEHGLALRRRPPPRSRRYQSRQRSFTHQEDQVSQGSPCPGSRHDTGGAAPVCAPSRWAFPAPKDCALFFSARVATVYRRLGSVWRRGLQACRSRQWQAFEAA
jgi:hypothetical protein